jgi:hypothetical protein
MYPLKQSMTVEELIKLQELLSKKLATIDIEGEVFVLARGTDNERVVDERVFNISHSTFCSFTGERKPDCQYSVPVHTLQNVGVSCVKRIAELESQILLLKQTEETINGLLPKENAATDAPDQKTDDTKKASHKKGKGRL